ncbi:MAG: PilW family protein [Acetatifactor sp.]
MRLFRKRILKLGNRGLSMVELICAIAIVSLLGTTVSSIMVVSANTYRRGAAETEVQQEAQLVANQISDLIIDTTKSVAVLANQVTITQEDETIIDIYLDGTTLKYKETRKELDDTGTEVTNIYGPDILAEYVTSFTPDATKFASNGSLKLGIVIEKDGHTFPNYFTITARNAVRESIAENASAKVILKIKKWLLEPCQSLVLNDSFAVASDGSAVTWKLDTLPSGESYDPDTKVELDGSNYKLTIGKGETRSWVRVVAEVDGKQAYLTVFIRRVTGIEGKATPLSGNSGKFEVNDTYKLTSIIDGKSLNQVTGASYDSDYVDTRAVQIELFNDNNPQNVYTSKAQIVGNELKITQEFNSGEYVLIKFTSKHAALGVNKTNQIYDPTITDTIKLVKALTPPLTISDNGWLRLSDDAQATVNGATSFGSMVLAMKPDVVERLNQKMEAQGITDFNPQFAHTYIVKYKKHDESTWVTYDTPWVSGADASNSGSINIRPLISGVMDPLYDYDVEITWIVYAVDTRCNFKEMIYEYTFGNTVKRMTVGFSNPEFTGSQYYYSWPMSKAIDFTGKTGNLLTFEQNSVTGIQKDKNIHNWLRFEIQKQQADGSWSTVDNNTIQTQNQSGSLYIAQKAKVPGLYRARITSTYPVFSINTTNGSVSESGSTTVINLYKNSPYGEEEGIFYFKIEQQLKFYSYPLSISYEDSVLGIPASSNKTLLSFNKDQEVVLLSLDQSNSISEVKFDDLQYKLFKWDDSNSAWVADTDISVSGSTEVRIKTTKEGLTGLYSLWLYDKAGNALYDTSTGNGIFCFWIGSAGEVPAGIESAVPGK